MRCIVGKDNLASLVASQLYLPREWLDDPARRATAHIPDYIKYKTQPEIAIDVIRDAGCDLPFQWVLGDDEFGRAQYFRDFVYGICKY